MSRSVLRTLFAAVFGANILTASWAKAADVLTFDALGAHPVERYLQLLMKEAYADLGITLNYVAVPLARAVKEVQIGQLDGLHGKVAMTEQGSELLQIPVPLMNFDMVLLCDLSVVRQCDIATVDTVVTVRGFKAFNDYRQANVIDAQIIELTTRHQVIDFLQRGRVHAAVLSRPYVQGLVESYPERWQTATLSQHALYHVMHKKHAQLYPRLQAVLQRWQASGKLSAMQSLFLVEDSVI